MPHHPRRRRLNATTARRSGEPAGSRASGVAPPARPLNHPGETAIALNAAQGPPDRWLGQRPSHRRRGDEWRRRLRAGMHVPSR